MKKPKSYRIAIRAAAVALLAGIAVLVTAVVTNSPDHAHRSPASEMTHLGYAPKTTVQSNADTVAAKAVCTLIRDHYTVRQIISMDTDVFYGNRAKTTEFVNNSINLYCPKG